MTKNAATATRNHENCEKALSALQDAERVLGAALHHAYITPTDASGYFPRPRRHGSIADLAKLEAAIHLAAGNYVDLLAIHAEDGCCPIEGY